MSRLVPLDDAADERLADYVQLREVNLRRLLEEEHGLFIAEGAKVIRRAAEAGYEPRSFLLAPRWLDTLQDVLDKWPSVPVYVVSEELAEKVTGFHVHRGALASYKRRASVGLEVLLEGLGERARVAIFDDIVDHTNVGAGFRAAAAMGVDAVLVSPTCADPLYRGRSRCRWGRSSRCRGRGSRVGRETLRGCGNTGSWRLVSPCPTTRSAWTNWWPGTTTSSP